MALNQVPNPTQTLGQTNLPIKQNFQTIDTGFSVDHVTFGAAGVGKHQKVTFPNTTPVPAFVAPDIGLFNQLAVPTTRQDIWMARGASTPFPITGYEFNNTATDGRGWTYLPSGLKMIWGKSMIAGAGSTNTITFNSSAGGGVTGFPGFSTVVGSIIMSRIAGGAGNIDGFPVLIDSNYHSSLASFQFRSSSTSTANREFTWLAIGL